MRWEGTLGGEGRGSAKRLPGVAMRGSWDWEIGESEWKVLGESWR